MQAIYALIWCFVSSFP